MGVASTPVTGAATGRTGGGTTVRRVNSSAGANSCLARVAAARAKSEPSVAMRALAIRPSLSFAGQERGGTQVADEVGEAGVGVEHAGGRHYVGRSATADRRLEIVLRVPVIHRHPYLQAQSHDT